MNLSKIAPLALAISLGGVPTTAAAISFTSEENLDNPSDSFTIDSDDLDPSFSSPSNSQAIAIDGEAHILIDAIAADDSDNLHDALVEKGLKLASAYEKVVSGWFPVEAIPEMESIDSLKFYREALYTTNVGSAINFGDFAVNADIARNTFGVDGSGATVGVLSDSFNNLGGADADIASGDLPGLGNPLGNNTPVNVLQDLPSDGVDEGRAMLQIVHDVAPNADLAFHTAAIGQAGYANAILALAEQGSNIEVDDLIFFAEPMFQDGIVAQAVDQVEEDGVAYFSAAGNENRNGYESSFNQSGIGNSLGEFHDFDPGEGIDPFQSITIPAGTPLDISFQWDSPFFSVSGGNGSPNDLNIFLLDENLTTVLAGSAVDNVGGDAVEVLSFFNDGSFGSEQFNLLITGVDGPVPEFMKYVAFGPVTINEFDTNSGTIYGHRNAVGAEAVGAAFFSFTPRFGTNPPVLEPFSSAGPTPIFFDTQGDRLGEPEIRLKPEIVAPDGVNTTFFPEGGPDIEGDGFPNFFGTSAAAPQAAAVAALMRDANSDIGPEAIYPILEQTAIDMNEPGFDFDSGFGLIQAEQAVAQAQAVPEANSALALLALGVFGTGGWASQAGRRQE